ncbi:MAG: TolC family protein, partial [Planctomycetota bacterium]
LTVTQPLLRGRGIAVTEPLTQAERNLIYEMRRFVRFRRTFFTQVYSEYFDVLQQRQVVRNENLNLENLRRALERAQAMFDAGRLPGFQVDQTEQDVLRAEDRLERAQQSYHRTLDQFKNTLGIKPDINIVLTMKELQQMEDAREPQLPWPRDRAVEIATSNRLDLQTARDEIADARRKVKVAINDLKPGLDVTLEAGSTTGNTRPVDFSGDNNRYTAGLELDLPLERTAERNRYREQLIDLQSAQRAAERSRDQIIQGVREAWRSYFRAWESYRIQKNSVELAQERVDSTTMLLEAGRASTRDMLEARESLIQAQNSLSQSLVGYRVTRLELARDMGTLQISDTYNLREKFQAYDMSSTGDTRND